jgi:hypothetical protein
VVAAALAQEGAHARERDVRLVATIGALWAGAKGGGFLSAGKAARPKQGLTLGQDRSDTSR